MSTLFEQFTRAHTQAVNNWQRNFVLTYGTAYTNARASFMKTLKEQEEKDKAARERYAAIAMFALSLCGGSILTAVFGQACAKAAAAQIAVDVICEREMNRAFKVASFISSNKTASFALGSVWDAGAGYLSDKLKGSFAENGNNFPSLTEFAQEPQSVQNKLDKWVRDAYAKVLAAEEDISKNVKDENVKTKQISDLIKSPFFRAAPLKSPNEEVLTTEIELTFFMKLLLDLDYVAQFMVDEKPRGGWSKREVSRRPISAAPDDPKYPGYKRVGMWGDYEDVVYKQIGDVIKDRIDELNKKRFKDKFFTIIKGHIWDDKENISRDTLRRAHWKLNELGDANLKAIQQSLSG
jgi:hypothetical protein